MYKALNMWICSPDIYIGIMEYIAHSIYFIEHVILNDQT